ncbi:MAG: CBS domain-containing protein [Euryarchaeota archaeon]|nr:CBS domain-containing protein [Euryarchaeota archaeon]
MKNTIEENIETNIAKVSGDSNLADALDTMIENDSSVVMVVDGEDIIGLMTTEDMVTMVTQGVDLENNLAKDFASLCRISGNRPCTRVDHDEESLDVLKVLQSWGTGRVLVVKNNEVVGTISALGALKSWKKRV